MKNEIRKQKFLFKAAIISIAISSASVIMVIFADFDGTSAQKIVGYIVGILFWTGLIIGYLMLGLFNKRRKKFSEKISPKSKPKLGIFCFKRTPQGFVADISCLVLIVLLLVLSLAKISIAGLNIVIIAGLIFAVQMHGIFNGENFVYLQDLRKEQS